MHGPNFGHRNRFEALKQEYGNRCCFCGKKGGEEVKLRIGHLYPKTKEEINRWENLITICDKCNNKQGDRTYEDAGMKFAVIKDKVFNPAVGRMITVNRKLSPKPLSESKVNKYMTHTDIGIRKLKKQIKAIWGKVPVNETHGYITSYFRNTWQMEKEHYNDAVVIASDKNDLNAKSQWRGTAPQTIKPAVKGGKLFNTHPLQFKDGKFYQNITLIGRKAQMRSPKHKKRQRNVRVYGSINMAEIEFVTSLWKKEILSELRDKLGYKKGDKDKSFTPDDIIGANLPFRAVTIEKRRVGESATRKINNNIFRASDEVNKHIMVYSTAEGKLKAVAVKNPKIFKDVKLPDDFVKKIFVVKKGDIITWRKDDTSPPVTGKVFRCLTMDGLIDIKGLADEKGYKRKNPVYIRQIYSPEKGMVFTK